MLAAVLSRSAGGSAARTAIASAMAAAVSGSKRRLEVVRITAPAITEVLPDHGAPPRPPSATGTRTIPSVSAAPSLPAGGTALRRGHGLGPTHAVRLRLHVGRRHDRLVGRRVMFLEREGVGRCAVHPQMVEARERLLRRRAIPRRHPPQYLIGLGRPLEPFAPAHHETGMGRAVDKFE